MNSAENANSIECYGDIPAFSSLFRLLAKCYFRHSHLFFGEGQTFPPPPLPFH